VLSVFHGLKQVVCIYNIIVINVVIICELKTHPVILFLFYYSFLQTEHKLSDSVFILVYKISDFSNINISFQIQK
jgi:hypothetical protein